MSNILLTARTEFLLLCCAPIGMKEVVLKPIGNQPLGGD